MRLMISTPCYGGTLMHRYVTSLIESVGQATAENLFTEWYIHFQDRESLIHRARNRAAQYFLDSGFDRLLTIDADIDWTYDDFKRVVTSPHDIVGGIYPLKSFPVVMNFNPLPERGTEFFKSQRGIDYDAWGQFKAKYTDNFGLVEVRHLATGFLAVDRKVFESLAQTCETYATFDSASGEYKKFFNFYPSDIKGEILRSEDWGFCDIARQAGFRIYLDTNVCLGHTGNHRFRLGQFYGESGVM